MANEQHVVEGWIREAQRAGWRAERRSGGHWRLYPADRTKGPLTISASPGDRRALAGIRADFRRAGLDVEV